MRSRDRPTIARGAPRPPDEPAPTRSPHRPLGGGQHRPGQPAPGLRPPDGVHPGRHLAPCPFCPGNEESATPTLETLGPDGKWLVRVVPNLYPAFEGNAPFVVTNRGPVFTQATAGGIHEVFVLSPDHQNSWSMLSDEQTTRGDDAPSATGSRSTRPSPGSATARPSSTPGARRAPPSSTPTASCSGCPSSPASWWRSRPASPGSPAGACCARRWTPRRTSGTGWSTPTSRSWSSARSGAARPTRCWSIPRAHGPHLHHSPTHRPAWPWARR